MIRLLILMCLLWACAPRTAQRTVIDLDSPELTQAALSGQVDTLFVGCNSLAILYEDGTWTRRPCTVGGSHRCCTPSRAALMAGQLDLSNFHHWPILLSDEIIFDSDTLNFEAGPGINYMRQTDELRISLYADR